MIGQAINKIAEEKSMTKYRIAKNGQLAQTTLGDIVHGRNVNPSFETMTKIAKGLGMHLWELIKIAEELEESEVERDEI